MRIMVSDGTGYVLNPALREEPRLSQSQRQALEAAGRADSNAQVAGLDKRLRPVVRATSSAARRAVEYALLRNGEPAPVSKPLSERWTDRTLSR